MHAKHARTDNAKKKKEIIKPVKKSFLTRAYDKVKKTAYRKADAVRDAFFGDNLLSTALWFAAVVICLIVLLWFFFVSPYGTPAEPIYEGF